MPIGRTCHLDVVTDLGACCQCWNSPGNRTDLVMLFGILESTVHADDWLRPDVGVDGLRPSSEGPHRFRSMGGTLTRGGGEVALRCSGPASIGAPPPCFGERCERCRALGYPVAASVVTTVAVRLACWVCARVHASTAGGTAPLAVLDSGLPRRALSGAATTPR